MAMSSTTKQRVAALGIGFELTKQGGELRKVRTAMNLGESWILNVTSIIDLSCVAHSRKSAD